MSAPYVDFRKLKEAVGIRRVLERYGLLDGLRGQGDRLSGPCPICDKVGGNAFRVSQSKNCFMCFSCGTGGNVLDFVAAMEECGIREAAVVIAGWFGIDTGRPERGGPRRHRKQPRKETPEPSPAPAGADAPADAIGGDEPCQEPAPQAVEPRTAVPLTFELKLDPEHPWIAGAGLLPETVAEAGIGYCSKGMMGGRIAFPMRDASGGLLGYAGRWPGESPPDGQTLWKYPKGLDLGNLIYPADKLAGMDPDRILLACDPLGVLLARQAGVTGAACLPGVDLAEMVRPLLAG